MSPVRTGGGLPTASSLNTDNDQLDRSVDLLNRDVGRLLASPLAGAQQVLVAASQPSSTAALRMVAPGNDTPLVPLLTGRTNVIAHGLGRAPAGRLITYATTSARVYDIDVMSFVPPLDPARYLALLTTADTTVKLVVF